MLKLFAVDRQRRNRDKHAQAATELKRKMRRRCCSAIGQVSAVSVVRRRIRGRRCNAIGQVSQDSLYKAMTTKRPVRIDTGGEKVCVMDSLTVIDSICVFQYRL